MNRPRIIIADEEERYVESIQCNFAEMFFNKIDLEIITKADYFNEFFIKPQSTEILIVSEQFYNANLERHNIEYIFVLTEQRQNENTEELNITRLYKYSSFKEILNEIVSKSVNVFNMATIEKKETQIVVVTSAAGGVGKTTVSMGIAECLEKNYKRVLYINASRLQNFQELLDNQSPIVSSDIYANLLDYNENIFSELTHVIRKEEFSYIPPFKASLVSLGLEFSIYRDIALSAKNRNEYDYIVVDLENAFDNEYTQMLGIADKVIVISTQNRQAFFHTVQLINNINVSNTDKYVFVCNKFIPDEENSFVSQKEGFRFSVDNYIEKIGTIEQCEMSEYAKIQGIQKLAVSLM